MLADEHEIEAEVIDPRTLRPLDLDTILESVRKTNRCVIVEEGWPHGGVGANLAALIQEQAFDYLDAPIGARHRRRPADAVLQAARADRLPARAADRRGGAARCSATVTASRSQQVLQPPRQPGRVEVSVPQPQESISCGHRLLGAATVAVLAAGALATTGVLGSSHREAPRIMLDPSADNTDVYAFTAPDAPGQADRRLELGPAAEPGGRAVLRQARSGGPLLRQDRQHRRRRRGRRLPLAVQATSSATRTRSCTRCRR